MPLRYPVGRPGVRQHLRERYGAVHNKNELAAFIRHYSGVFAIFGVFGAYLSTFFSTRGISTAQIGLLMAIGPMTSLIVQPIWGILADKSRDKTRILRIIPIGSALTILLYFVPSDFLGFAAVTFLFMVFNTAITPISDAYTVNYLTQNAQKFSTVRLCGSFAYTVAAFVSGLFLNNGNLWIIFPYSALAFVAVFFNAGTLPKMQLDRSHEHKPFLEVIRNKKLILILVFVFFMQLSMFFNASFLGVYIKELGFSDHIRGIIFGLVALSEIPVLLVIDRAIRRFPVFTILIFSGFVMIARAMIYAFLPTPGFIILSQCLSGLTFIPVTYSAITYINDEMPVEYKTTGQSLLAFVQQGAGSILGSVLGGQLSARFGIGNTYGIFAGLLTITTTVFLVMEISRRRTLNRALNPANDG